MLATACGSTAAADKAPKLDIDKLRSSTTPYQAEMLDDRKVDFAEYERATLVAIQCMRQAGLTVSGPSLRDGDRRFLSYTYSLEASSPTESVDDNGMRNTAEECERKHLRAVATTWEFRNLLTPRQRASERREIVKCLRAAGVKIESDANDDAVFDAVHKASRELNRKCTDNHQDFFTTGAAPN
jgi:hypothetical protein